MKKTHYIVGVIAMSLLLPSCQKTVIKDIVANTTTTTTYAASNDSLYSIAAINNPEPGQIFLTLNGTYNGTLLVLNQNGQVIKQKEVGPSISNFQKWVINGTVRYTYNKINTGGYRIPGVGNLPGWEFICDSNFNILKQVALTAYGDVTTSPQGSIDGHDFILLDDNHYITETYYQKTVNNIPDSLHPAAGIQVAAIIIQEVQNGSVIWQWDGTNYPEFYSTSIEGNTFSDASTVADYMHLNSMYIDPRDNNLICSFRNLDQIVKINRTTGAIIWRLGGRNSDFPMTADEIFLRQHNATLTDSNQTLLIFDDGEIAQRPTTRIVEFKLNEDSHTINSFKAFQVPEPFTQYTGSVQKRGDTYFIGGGTASYTLEINYNTGQRLLELTQKEQSYRAFKY